jgi:hypothetical protein
LRMSRRAALARPRRVPGSTGTERTYDRPNGEQGRSRCSHDR